MKTNNFLWATLATAILTLTGCSSDATNWQFLNRKIKQHSWNCV